MSAIDPSLRRLLWWAVPIVVLAGTLAVELDRGRSARSAAGAASTGAPVPAPVSVGLLPEYTIAGGAVSLAAISERTLFNPTRRPAPPAVAGSSEAPSQMQRGQFVLTGTAIYAGDAVAYLKEVKTGKPHTVKKGETINGLRVASVDSKGVRLTMGDESEDLPLKVAAGPRTTVQPATAPHAPGGRTLPPGQRPRPGAPQANPGGAEPPMSLGERRRAARAAEVARQRAEAEARRANATPGDAAQSSTGSTAQQPGATGTPSTNDQRWQQMYQRFRGRGTAPQ